MTRWVDFDELIYLQFDHSPGYAQWWVMLNLGHAPSPDGKGSAVILQRFRKRQDGEHFKEQILRGCIKADQHNQQAARPEREME